MSIIEDIVTAFFIPSMAMCCVPVPLHGGDGDKGGGGHGDQGYGEEYNG